MNYEAMNFKKHCIIGLSGGSGSGKTSMIRDLRKRFSENELCILSQDDYYKPRDKQDIDDQGITNFDKPSSIEHLRMYSDVEKLVRGEALSLTEYTFNNKLAKPVIKNITPAPILLLEGLFIFNHDELKNLLDVKVFVHAKDDLKIIRRIKRDRVERNYPLDDVLYRYEYHVTPTFEKYILPHKDYCDIVINNNDDYKKGLEFLEAFIRMKLSKFTSFTV